MSTPKVSVVMPVYNASRYLSQCLDSVVSQTLDDIEIVCVNDGSTDGSGDILEEYAAHDRRIRIISKKNEGYGAAMNDGIDASCGEYVGIVEPDDYVEADMYETLWKAATAHDCDVVKSDFLPFTGEGDTYRDQWYEICPGKAYYNKLLDSTKGESLFYVMMMNWTGIYRRRFLQEYGIRHNETPGAAFQDNGFWFQVFTFARRCWFINQAFYHYRTDNAGSSINSPAVAHRMIEEYQFIRDFLTQDDQRWTRLQHVFDYFYFDNLLARLSHLSENNQKEFKRFMAAALKRSLDIGELDFSYFPDYMIGEFTLIMLDPDAYEPSEHVNVEDEAWGEMADRHERTNILRLSNSPYHITSQWEKCLVEA